MMDYSLKFKKLKDLTGWTNRRLAARFKVSPSTVFNWYQGLCKPVPRHNRLIDELLEKLDKGVLEC